MKINNAEVLALLAQTADQGLSPRRQRQARDLIIMLVMPYVQTLAHKYRGYALDHEDLVQAGCLGVNQAIDKFDPTREVLFITYASWSIRRSMQREIEQHHKGAVTSQDDSGVMLPGARRRVCKAHSLTMRDGEELEVEAPAPAVVDSLVVHESAQLVHQAIEQALGRFSAPRQQRMRLMVKLSWAGDEVYTEVARQTGVTRQQTSLDHLALQAEVLRILNA